MIRMMMPGAMNSVKLGSISPYTGSFQTIGSWWRSVGSWQVERKLAVELERVSTTHLYILELILQWR